MSGGGDGDRPPAGGGGVLPVEPLGLPVFGPNPRPPFTPDPHVIVSNKMSVKLRIAINCLNADFTNRDCRYIMCGGAPNNPGI